MLKIDRTLNDISSVPTVQISIKVHRILPWVVPYLKQSNWSASRHIMATRAKNRINLKWHFLRNHLANFNQTSLECSLDCPLPLTAQIVSLPWTTWPQELKMEEKKTLAASTFCFEQHLLRICCAIINHCFLDGPPPKLLKAFFSAAQHGYQN